MSMLQLHGSMVAIVTPMQANGAIDYAAYQGLLDWHLEAGTQAVVVIGTTGESPNITMPEREKLIGLTVKHINGRIPVIAGAGTNSTAQSIELGQQIADLGVDASLVVTPYYNKPTQEGLYQHYMAIAERVELPMVLYNAPGRTAVDLLPETAIRLAKHRNIVAIKDATGDINRVEPLKAAGLQVLSGDDASAHQFIEAGGDGVVSVIANVLPKLWQQMCQAAATKDNQTVEQIVTACAALNTDLYCEANPAPVKWLLNHLGKIPNGIRLPLVSLSEVNQTTVLGAYKHVQPLQEM